MLSKIFQFISPNDLQEQWEVPEQKVARLPFSCLASVVASVGSDQCRLFPHWLGFTGSNWGSLHAQLLPVERRKNIITDGNIFILSLHRCLY